MNVFRITRAEFAKVFKKPTVYIMAFILAVVLVISLLSYNPALSQSSSVSIEGDNASIIYSTFMSKNESNIEDTKLKFDKAFFSLVEGQIDFYENIYNKSKNLTTAYEELNSSYIELSNTYQANNNAQNLTELMDKTKKKITNLLDKYGDTSVYENYEGFKNIINASSINDLKYYENAYFDVASNGKNYSYTTLRNNYVSKLDSETSVASFISIISTNEYMTIFKNLTTYGQDLIYNILNDVIDEILDIQNNFYELVQGSLTTTNKQLMTQKAIELNTKVDEFKSLIEGLIGNEFAFAVTTKTDYVIFKTGYDSFKTIYDEIEVNNDSEYISKQTGAKALKENSYISVFREYLDSLVFINVDKDFVDTLNSYSEIANKNKTSILDKIETDRHDVSTTPILNDITNYMLLGETYNEIVNCEVINQLSNDLTLSQAKDVKNFDMSNYNKYNNTNTIATLKYQLDNNTYSNSFGGTLSLEKTISSEKNMYDFTYYALKIATFLITIFTIMMIANLITSETDSGTIKLLLIRPYKRGTVLLGKILATFFFSLAFLLLSFAISMVAGYFMFGLPSVDTLLVTFNASKTFLIKPLYLLLIYFASCVGDILFYLIVALTISVLFKSYIGAISTSLITYVGAMVVGSLLSGSVVYAYLPFTNISWFRYFGGEIMPMRSGIGALLSSPVHSLQNFGLSVMISSIFSLILLIITFTSFKRRDF